MMIVLVRVSTSAVPRAGDHPRVLQQPRDVVGFRVAQGLRQDLELAAHRLGLSQLGRAASSSASTFIGAMRTTLFSST